MSEKGSSLVRKLAKITGECRRIQKRGWNDFHKYAYATEADVAAEVAPKLAENMIHIFPTVLKQDVVETINDRGKTEQLATVLMEFTIEDGESGEVRKIQMGGQGQDRGDKAIYKAMTGAQKYALLKLFQIETGLDPENDNGRAPENGERSTPPGASQNDGNRSGRTNTPNRGQSAGKKDDAKPQTSPEPSSQGSGQRSTGSITPPGYNKAKELAATIGWTATQMMDAINTLRKNHGQDPVDKWNDLEPEFRNQFFDKMKKRKENGLSGPQKQPDKKRVPSDDDLTDRLMDLSMDYMDFIRWVNRMRDLDRLGKIKTWNDLDESWKIQVYEKLQDKLDDRLREG